MNENFKIEPRSRKYEGLAPLTKDVNTLTRNVLGERGFVSVDLIAQWGDIVGKELSVGVLPMRLTFPKGKRSDGTLYVRTAGGAFALLFEHQKNRVIERVNTYFGYPAVSNIRLVQGAIKFVEPETEEVAWPLGDEETQEILQKIDMVQDEKLRAQLFNLGVAMIRKRKNT